MTASAIQHLETVKFGERKIVSVKYSDAPNILDAMGISLYYFVQDYISSFIACESDQIRWHPHSRAGYIKLRMCKTSFDQVRQLPMFVRVICCM